MTNHDRLVPSFIESTTPSGLRSLMVKTNLKAKQQHQYFDIQTYKNKRGQTKWIAWFFIEFTNENLEEFIK